MAYGTKNGPENSDFTLIVPVERVTQLISDLSKGPASSTDGIPVNRVNRPHVFEHCGFFSPVMEGFLQVVYEETRSYALLAYGKDNGLEKSDFMLIVCMEKVPQLISDLSNGLASALSKMTSQNAEMPSDDNVNSSSGEEMEPDVRQREIAGEFEHWKQNEKLRVDSQDVDRDYHPTTLECDYEFINGEYRMVDDGNCAGCKFCCSCYDGEWENCPGEVKLRELKGSHVSSPAR